MDNGSVFDPMTTIFWGGLMRRRTLAGGSYLFVTVLVVGAAYADTVDNPGPIIFEGNTDSSIESYGGGLKMYTQGSFIAGAVDSNGDTFFDEADIFFDVSEDANGYRTQLEATDDATGSYCPNSGAATIAMTARIRVTKVAGTTITPCFITLNSGNPFTLTTGTSGSLSGASFRNVEPKLVAEVDLGATVTGFCTTPQKAQIVSYYGLGSQAAFEMLAVEIAPTNLTGTGC